MPSKDPLLVLAAERYLLAEDSLPARKLLWQHRPNQAFVTGWRENGPFIGATDLDAMAKTEEKLRAELFKEDGPQQIFALLPNYDGYSRVLRIYPNKAIYTHYDNPSRYRERVVSEPELADFKEFVATSGLQDQGRNLQTGREFRVKLDPSDESRPIAFVPVHNKVLLLRAKAKQDRPGRVLTGPDQPEYYLLDPATGATQLVTGEFLPLHHEGARFLQPTGQPNEFWAALPYEGNRQTEVGRYNLKDFSFKPVLVVPQINFDSVSMWVDEARNKLYIVYEYQLLRLPLTPAVDPPR